MDDQFSDWHSVRPWQPTLSLSVREITSVSVTFILSSPYSTGDAGNPEPSLASLGISSSDDDESRDSASTVDTTTTQAQVVSDILGKGLSVKVNGTPWQRVILKMDEFLDEAIIILYGLMPSRQYDVELGILPGEPTVRGRITTDIEARIDTALPDALPNDSAASSPENTSIPLSSSPPHTNGAAHPSSTPPNGPSLEERRSQLTHTLNHLNTEQSTLTSSLKAARKESQKADAALRSEIDTLKRASDRHAAGESRARKKVLALQEAVKQTLAAARDIESLVQDIEGTLPALEERKAEIEQEWAEVKDEAEQVRARREEAERREKARAEAMQAELAGLVNRLEKLNNKREKLEGEGGVLAELEEKLRKLEEERERVEKYPHGYEGDAADSEDSGSRLASEKTSEDNSPDSDKPHHASTYHNHNHNPPFQGPFHPRKRYTYPQPQPQPQPHVLPHAHPHPVQHHSTRSSFPPRAPGHHEPIHRLPSTRSATHPIPGVINLQQQQQHASPPHKRDNMRAPFRPSGSSGSSSTSGAATPNANANALTANAPSALFSRAPRFEPGRVRAHSHSHPQGQAQAQLQMQMQASMAAKSELNPDSTPFAPRAAVVQAAASAVGTNVVGSGRVGAAL